MKQLLLPFLVITMLWLSSCASGFKSINPEKIPYSYTSKESEIRYSYAYDVLSMKGNKKYAKKERKHGLRVVAVKIENTTGQTLRLNDNLKLMIGNNQTVPVDPTIAAKELKQGVPIYLLYLLLNFSIGGTPTTTNGVTTTTGGTFIPSGPVIAGGNILVAASANKNFKTELIRYNLINKDIAPGQTAYGLVTLHTLSADPIRFEINATEASSK